LLVNFLILLAVSFSWAVVYVFIKIDEKFEPPIAIMAWRATIGFITLLLVSLALKRNLLKYARKSGLFLIFAILGVVLLWLGIVFGEQRSPAGMASVMSCVAPIITYLMIVFVLREENLSIPGVAGLLVSALGLVLVVGIDEILKGDSKFVGLLMVAGGFISFAVNCVIVQKFARDIDPLVNTTYFMGFATLILWVLSLTFEKPFAVPLNETLILSMLEMGLISTAGAYLGYYILIMRAGALFSSFTLYFIPIFGVLAGVIILGERITITQVVGVGIVLAGVYILNRAE
jgi:drug/metabolite transporter (DMT)-like permease